MLTRQQFVDIMAALPTGVAVVTTRGAEGRPCGLTSSAFTSVSADPPMLLVCIDRASRTLPVLLERGAFCVNFLRHGRERTCALFASKADDKFSRLRWTPTRTGMPLLHDDAIAFAECETERVVEAGDHVIVVGRVVGGTAADEPPLVYCRRAYGAFAPNPPLGNGLTSTMVLDGGGTKA